MRQSGHASCGALTGANSKPNKDWQARPSLPADGLIAPATLTGCPATTAPAGLGQSGLPVGLQIMGPYLEDATPIVFAQLLAREIGGFQPPRLGLA